MTERPCILKLLAKTTVFRNLDPGTLDLLQSKLTEICLAPEDVLFRNGACGEGGYIVASGVLRVGIDNHAGGETWLALLGAGDLAGELSLIDNSPRSATVTAMIECRLFYLRNSDFESICQSKPALYRSIARLVCDRLRITNQQVCDQRLGLEGRLALVMLKLSSAFGERLPDGRLLIRHRIAQGRIAEFTGASREKVNRQFKAWADAGLCNRIGNYYCLADLSEMRRLGCKSVLTHTG